MRIISQRLLPIGVMTEYINGSIDILPYKIDDNGEEYVDLFPNDMHIEQK
jgi:hypothetical protein